MFKKLKWWEKILGILTIIFPILYILAHEGAIPVNNETGKWFLLIIVLTPAVYLVIGSISMLIKGISEGFKAETSPISKGILICSLVSLTIGIYELYWFLFKGSELGLVLAVLSFVVSYISFYLWRKK